MWLFAMFDLPVVEKEARKEAARFRKVLLQEGFDMLQYSVYARYCGSEDHLKAARAALTPWLPHGGQVRFIGITDRQYGKMEVYWKQKKEEPEPPLGQLALF